MPYDALIIGAGPAGLFAAIHAAVENKRVLVLEKQPDPGRKLLLSGAGQCNFTNLRPIGDFLQAYGEHGRFLKPALFHFTNQDVMAFFQQHGVATMGVEENGKVFPRSRQARDILNVLTEECRTRGVEIRFNEPVTRLDYSKPQLFSIATALGAYASRHVILATGGKSYPSTGSTGDGYALAKALGHALIPPRPGLTPFFIKHYPLAACSGTSFKNLSVTLWRSDKKIKQMAGDLLLTHQGVSGPVVHNLARYAQARDRITLSFLAGDYELMKSAWLTDLEQNGSLKVRAWLKRPPLTQALMQALLAFAGITDQDTISRLSREKRLALLRATTAFPLEIEQLGDFTIAMVTCGGISLAEVDAKTMESCLVKGLYFAGEVLDIDGDSGGYDLQAAWSTGALAGQSAAHDPYPSKPKLC